MTDWREADKVDAHLVRDLYRKSWSDGKRTARTRIIEAMQAAGVTTVLDLWGGGTFSDELVLAGFRVIAVDDGSMKLIERGRPVSMARKRRALEYAGAEGGYEVRWGKAELFAAEADGAYLDFCGPWGKHKRSAVMACRHMKCVAVTLTPDHDFSTDAQGSDERREAYKLYLRMAWSGLAYYHQPRTGGRHVRTILDYRRSRGLSVFVFLLSLQRLRLPLLREDQRARTSPDRRAAFLVRQRAKGRTRYAALSMEEKALRARQVADARRRRLADPAELARARQRVRHYRHRFGAIPMLPCELCAAG